MSNKRYLYNPANGGVFEYEDLHDGSPSAAFQIMRQDRPDLIEINPERARALIAGNSAPTVEATAPALAITKAELTKVEGGGARVPLFDASKVDPSIVEALAPVFEQIDAGDEPALRSIATSFEFTLPPGEGSDLEDLRDLTRAGVVRAFEKG